LARPKIKDNPVIDEILYVASDLLVEEGAGGFTMRKVAAGVGISPGHLRHYFNSKDALFIAMVDEFIKITNDFYAANYFEIEEITQLTRKEVERIIYLSLEASQLPYYRKALIEFWLLAARNQEILDHLTSFYKDYREGLINAFQRFNPEASDAACDKAANLLIPYIEGYMGVSYTVTAPLKEQAADLTDLVVTILAESS